MIVSNLIGGLGNQLFQYAAGLQVANEFSLKYYDGISSLSKYPTWTYKLGLLFRQDTKHFYRNLPVYNEASYRFNEIILPSLNGTVLNGYFQSWKYSDKVINDIRVNAAKSINYYPQAETLYKKLLSCNSAFFHIRRGDYLSNGNENYHGVVCNSKVEKTLRALIESKQIDCICGFGDDVNLVQRVVDEMGECIPMVNVSRFNLGDIPEMLLMSACKFSVIANSSFSWWGAHLSSRLEQEVYYPEKWFAHNEHDTRDLCPPKWVPY